MKCSSMETFFFTKLKTYLEMGAKKKKIIALMVIKEFIDHKKNFVKRMLSN